MFDLETWKKAAQNRIATLCSNIQSGTCELLYSSPIHSWSMQRHKNGVQANTDRIRRNTIPLSAVQSAEGVRELFDHYQIVYHEVSTAGRRSLERSRLQAREKRLSIDPDLVEAAPLGLELNPLDCPELFREGLLTPKTIGKMFSRIRAGEPVRKNKKSIQALRAISRIIVRDDMLKLEYTIWSLKPDQDGRLRRVGESFWHTVPLSELRKKYATFTINWYIEICSLYNGSWADGSAGTKKVKDANFFYKFLSDYIDTYEIKSAEARRRSLELRRDWFHGKRNDVVGVID